MENPESTLHENTAAEAITKSAEATPETVEKTPDEKVKRPRVRKEKSAKEAEQIEKLSTSIKVQQIMAEKPKGDEPFSSEPVPDVVPSRKDYSKPWWKKVMVTLGFAGLMAGAKAESKPLSDTTEKHPNTAAAFRKEPVKNPEVMLTLSQPEMRDWNDFVDYVKERGYEGSPELDVKGANLGKQLIEEFQKLHPGTTVRYETVARVQLAMAGAKKNAQEFAKRRNDPNAENLMSGISKVDGWPGSKTTQYKFPIMKERVVLNKIIKSEENIGLVGAQFPTKRKLPPGAKVEKLADGYYFEDPQSGDLVRYE